MKKYFIALALLFATTFINGQSNSSAWFLLGFGNSAVDDIAEQLPDYNFYRTSDGELVRNSDGKFDMVRKVTQYAFNFNNDYQFYLRRKNEILINDSRLFAVIYQRKRTNLL